MIGLRVLIFSLAALVLPAKMVFAESCVKHPLLANMESSTPLCQVSATFFYPIDDTEFNEPKTSIIAAVWENGVCIRTKNGQFEGNAGGLPYEIGTIKMEEIHQLKDNLRKALKKDYDRLSKHGIVWLDDVPWISIEINLEGKKYRLQSAHDLIKWLGPGLKLFDDEAETRDYLSFWRKIRELCMAKKFVRLVTIEDKQIMNGKNK